MAPALAVLLGGAAELRAVRVTALEERTALRILTTEDVAPAGVAREGGDLVVRIAAPAVEPLELPLLPPPLGLLRLERTPGATVLRFAVAPEVPFESRHEPGLTTVLLGERSALGLGGSITPEVYARLFPAGLSAETPGGANAKDDAAAPGIALGRVALRPFLNASWVDADIQTSGAEAVRARYLQVGPGLTASAPFVSGTLAAEYEPRLRFFSNVPQAEAATHSAGARLDLPAGSAVTVRLGHRFTRATLETTLVDPGREYAFDLSRFTFHETTLGLRWDLGARLFAEAGGSRRWVDFDSKRAGFFDHISQTANAGLGYDLGGDSRVLVNYSLQRVPPPPDRPVAETTAHAVSATFVGAIGPLMTGSLAAGYRTQSSPQAEGASRSYRGLVLNGGLRRELGHSTSLELQLGRSTSLSAFADNAYYLNEQATLTLAAPLPLQIWARGSASALRNSYPEPLDTGEKRLDEILAWTIGLSRTVGWRTSLRLDYRQERRDSNLRGHDLTTSGFVLQLAVGLSGPGGTR